MTGDVGDPMEAEFDTVAEWTAQVAADLGPEYLVPAACRGSGQPAALDWLLAGLRPRPGDPMVDVGAGTGGPAAYAAGRTGARPVLVEPEPDACRAAARLFDAPVIQADGTALPFADGAVGLAWSLGVLCTAPGHDAQLAMLRELHRVVRPGSGSACSSTWPSSRSWTIRRRATTSRHQLRHRLPPLTARLQRAPAALPHPWPPVAWPHVDRRELRAVARHV
jgi:SAM-dependent methyltransferase